MSRRTELQGFLSVKIPPKMRGFLPWKSWKKQWISVRRLPSGGVDLLLGRSSQNVLHVSPNDIIVRTQSRSHMYAFGVYPRDGVTANFCLAGNTETDSQKWISTLRKLVRPPLLPVEEGEFMVSVIDNFFTRSSGFPGLYGILRVNSAGIIITDPFTSKVVAHWLWSQLSYLYVASTLNKEDRGRVCTIITSSEFPTGIGKIRLFCDEALDLIRNMTRGRYSNLGKFQVPMRTPSRHHTFSYNPRNGDGTWVKTNERRPDSVKLSRRISKSEGNLFSIMDQLDSSSDCSDSGFIRDFYNNLFSSCFTEHDDKFPAEINDSSSCQNEESSRKVNCSGDIDLTSGEIVHVYQEVGEHLKVEEDFPIGCRNDSRTFCPRRQSGISVASGVYEEIDELSATFTCDLNTVEEDETDLPPPPPLPPRRISLFRRGNGSCQKMSTLNLPDFPVKYLSKSAGSTPIPSPPSLSRTPSSAEFFPMSWQGETESHYLPMNSRNRFPVLAPPGKNIDEEQHYVVMSSFITDQT